MRMSPAGDDVCHRSPPDDECQRAQATSASTGRPRSLGRLGGVPIRQVLTSGGGFLNRNESTPAAGASRWLALAVLCTGMLMIVIDATVVNVALPSIQRELRFS